MSATLHAVLEPFASPGSPGAITAVRSRDPVPVAHAVAVLCAADHSGGRPLDPREAEALAMIYRQYAGMLLTAARRMLGSSTDAEDAVHDLFSRLPRLLAQYHGRGLGGWLRRCVVNEALMGLRRARVRREEVLHPDHGEAHAMHTAFIDAGEIGWALRRLPPRLREVVVLRYFVGSSHREIAEILEISATASEVRLCRAMKQLRLMLQHSAGRRSKAAEAGGSMSAPTRGESRIDSRRAAG